jgi:L-lactate dehydrogenase complex protein LldF
VDRQAMQGFLFAMGNRKRYEQAGKLASLGTNMMASLSGGTIKVLPPPLSAWTNSRDFPAFAKKSFREQWAERLSRRKTI